MSVRLTTSAQNTLDAAMIYIAARNSFAVRPFADRIRKAIDQISLFPESGSPIPEFPHAEYRQVFARPYRIFYRVADEEIVVTALYHDRQLPLEPEPELQ